MRSLELGLKSKQPYFKIVNVGHKYYVYLRHGHRYTGYFGKVVENCVSPCGKSYTLVLLKFSKLAKLHFTKGINYFHSMDTNLRAKLQEKQWFQQFQKIIMVTAASYDTEQFPFVGHKLRTQLVKGLVRRIKKNSAKRLIFKKG